MIVDEGWVHPHGLYGCWGGTKDVPVHEVHDEGEQQETDKEDTHGGDVRREPQVDALATDPWDSALSTRVLWVGGYGGMREGSQDVSHSRWMAAMVL